MKNIAYLANIRLPTEKAHGIQIMKTCESLARKGHKISLIVSNRSKIKEDIFSYYNVEKNFNIIPIPCPEFFFLGKLGFLLMNIFFSQLASHYVWKLKADIVYSRDYFLLLDQFIWPQKKIWEVHDGKWNFLIKMMKISGVVAISNGLKNFYLNKGLKNIIVAHDAVDLKEFETDETADLGFKKEKKIIMYIGHLYGWKGVDTFLKASKLLPNLDFVIIGGNEKEIKSLEVDFPQVKFLGYKPYKELAKNQKAADILIIPNSAKSDISRLYTSPLKVFAHMTSNVPIIASDLPSLREVLNENNAYFFEADNEKSLASTIEKVINDNEESIKKAAHAKIDVQNYTWEKRAEIISNFIQNK